MSDEKSQNYVKTMKTKDCLHPCHQ